MRDLVWQHRRFRVLDIVDDVTRECLPLVVDIWIPARRVVRELGDLITEGDRPKTIPHQTVGSNTRQNMTRFLNSCYFA